MSLPFVKDSGKRKYQCFVCGMMHEDFEEYKLHVIVSHENGRDFVICPLDRCGAPVRDVRSHFAVHHKYDKIPKNCQMKAIVWKDQKKDGKLVNRKPKFREGYLVSSKNGGKEMHYRSGMECDVYECLEAMSEVMSYAVEPFKVQYTFEGTPHDYNPDLSIVFADGHTEIWEIKPSSQTTLPKNNAKWTACEHYCQARGYQFMVLTEVGLSKMKQKIRNR